MPFIEETDLLDLHKDIEKSQIINERLLDQVGFKNKDLKKLRIQRNVLAGVTFAFLLMIFGFWAFFSGYKTSNELRNQEIVFKAGDSLNTFRNRINHLKERNEELSLVKEFYLAKKILEKEKIYSVQVKSFVENNTALTSEALTNTLFVKTNPFYAYSLGNFETLDEAKQFRKQLVSMGFKDAFVASYKDGKRLRIEDSF